MVFTDLDACGVSRTTIGEYLPVHAYLLCWACMNKLTWLLDQWCTTFISRTSAGKQLLAPSSDTKAWYFFFFAICSCRSPGTFVLVLRKATDPSHSMISASLVSRRVLYCTVVARMQVVLIYNSYTYVLKFVCVPI